MGLGGQDVLNDVVPKLILNQVEAVRGNLCDQRILLDFVGIVNAPVNEGAANFVSCYIHTVVVDGVVDKLVALSRELLQE